MPSNKLSSRRATAAKPSVCIPPPPPPPPGTPWPPNQFGAHYVATIPTDAGYERIDVTLTFVRSGPTSWLWNANYAAGSTIIHGAWTITIATDAATLSVNTNTPSSNAVTTNDALKLVKHATSFYYVATWTDTTPPGITAACTFYF